MFISTFLSPPRISFQPHRLISSDQQQSEHSIRHSSLPTPIQVLPPLPHETHNLVPLSHQCERMKEKRSTDVKLQSSPPPAPSLPPPSLRGTRGPRGEEPWLCIDCAEEVLISNSTARWIRGFPPPGSVLSLAVLFLFAGMRFVGWATWDELTHTHTHIYTYISTYIVRDRCRVG